MPTLTLRPSNKAVAAYYESLAAFEALGATHELAVKTAFATLLEAAAKPFGWKLVPEHSLKGAKGKRIVLDGTLMDLYRLRHGDWEAKDESDDLAKEVRAKIDKGYPLENILFWEPRRAILYQHGEKVDDQPLDQPEALLTILKRFLEFAPRAIAEWEAAVAHFKDIIPQLGKGLAGILKTARKENPKYGAAFAGFVSLCRTSLNPNLSEAAVEEMLVQHLLTERILRKIFDIENFRERNVIAADIEKVIATLTAKHFKRDDFLKALDPFYAAIEVAAETFTDFTEKQKFLNIVYERFFQGFAVKQADVLGVVYTPQPLVQFMIKSVEHVLAEHFDTTLSAQGVHIFDPFTGTGNFIVNLMQHLTGAGLRHKYREELHCNEVSLLPYYVASMNIEHAYYERTQSYEPFEGVCLVDTFETVEKEQAEFDIFNEANSERVKRQRAVKDLRVILANPPYNAWQQDENDNNKNRKYPEMDRRVNHTYSDDSEARNRIALGDPYIKAFRFASDRIGDSGIVCYVSNNGFVDGIACDGMRKHLAQDFDLIYVLDLGGNVRKNPKLSGTTHNIFGIQVGVCVTVLVRMPGGKRNAKRKAKIHYHAVPVDWRRETKEQFLNEMESIAGVKWGKPLRPDARYTWLTNDTQEEFATHIPIGAKSDKDSQRTIFTTFCNGAKTNNDSHVYDFDRERLAERAREMVETYETEQLRWQKHGGGKKRVEDVIKIDAEKLKWVRRTKRELERGTEVTFDEADLRCALYRPFTKRWLFMNRVFCEELYRLRSFFPKPPVRKETPAIVLTDSGSEKPFMVIATTFVPDHHLVGGGASAQMFPLYTYSEDGKHRQENVRLSAHAEFQAHYDDDTITRADIFHYVYAVLHHPDYRERYAENLKRELPRIPFATATEEDRISRIDRMNRISPTPAGKRNPVNPENPVNPVPKKSAIFHAFADAGRKLAELHVGYESVKPCKLKRIENPKVPVHWRVEAMKLSKEEDAVIYNEWLTLHGLPPETHEYRLGNRSALAWVIDQYRVERDKDDEIVSDPNDPEDEEAIVRLVGQVVTVSVETMKLVKSLPELNLDAAAEPGSTVQAEASAAHFHYIAEEPETYGDKS